MRKFVVTVLLAAIAGCGEAEAPPLSKDEVGVLAKQQVMDFVAKAKEDPILAAEELPVLMESLTAYAENTVGPQKLAYTKLQRTAKDLQEMYAASADSYEIDAKLDELGEAAQNLPGSAAQALD